MSVVILVVALVVGALLAFHPRLRSSKSWSATVTPLASIMGSGFLVSAPLLVALAGVYAPLAMAVLLGLLIIVQGFETSRFLGGQHPAKQRIATMRRAQLMSAAVYLSFTTLALVLFGSGWDAGAGGVDVTAIVRLVGPVAVVLPVLIVIVAAASQFSAAVADDAGCAGLMQVLFAHRLPSRDGYLLIGAATIALTWGTDVLGIISLASRAFAAFYALQCCVALATALKRPDGKRRLLFAALCLGLGLVCVAVTLFGIPAE